MLRPYLHKRDWPADIWLRRRDRNLSNPCCLGPSSPRPGNLSGYLQIAVMVKVVPAVDLSNDECCLVQLGSLVVAGIGRKNDAATR